MVAFDDIFKYSNLYKAYLACLKGKRHKQEAIDFSLELSRNLWELYYDLKYHRYAVGGYREFIIHDPKERMIQAISFRDRVVQHCLVDNYLTPLLNRRFIYDNGACQIGKGTSFTNRRLRLFLTQHFKRYGRSGYVVKIDIRKYFESINHQVLKEALEEVVDDHQVFALLKSIIDSYHSATQKGLPMGNQTSQCFALLYLDSLDHYIKEILKVKHYIRYMDDLLLLIESKDKAMRVFSSIERYIETKTLMLNPKSCYRPLVDGFEMLGWRYKLSHQGKIIVTLRRSTRKRIKERVKAFNSSITNIDKIREMKAAYKGFLQYGNANGFYRSLWR